MRLTLWNYRIRFLIFCCLAVLCWGLRDWEQGEPKMFHAFLSRAIRDWLFR